MQLRYRIRLIEQATFGIKLRLVPVHIQDVFEGQTKLGFASRVSEATIDQGIAQGSYSVVFIGRTI